MLKTKLYIKGCGAITPQTELPDLLSLPNPKISEKPYLSCIEPDYKLYIEPMKSRRMSRIMKMGLVAAKMCINDAGIDKPSAIITGTGLGCMEDTEKFLGNMILNEEQLLNPTPFIQSTHNTIGAQIAIHLNCNGYNITFVHRGHSFESALTDAILYSSDHQNADILVGGFDELTKNAFHIMQRLGLFRNSDVEAGEGAVFLILNTLPSDNDYACLQAVDVFNPSETTTVAQRLQTFLSQQSIDIEAIDLMLCGSPQDVSSDPELRSLLQATNIQYYKQLCGEYPTASAFAFSMAAKIIKQESSIKNVLVWNNYLHINHSFFLLSAC